MICPRGLCVARVKVINVNKALARVMSLPLAKRAAIIHVFNDNLIYVEEQLQDMLIRQKDIINNSKKFSLKGIELEDFNTHNTLIHKATKRVLKAQEEKNKYKTLIQKMFSKKGAHSQDFGEYIINSLLEKGKNFYSNLSSLF